MRRPYGVPPVPIDAFVASSMSPEIASMISGRSSRRLCCSGDSRFCTYRSWRISSSDRPRSCSRITYIATCSSAELRWKRNEKRFLKTATGRDCIPGVRRSSREGRYAERVLVGVDDIGREERIVLWIERRPGAVWVVGRAGTPQLRESDELRSEDVVFAGFELEDALQHATVEREVAVGAQ